ncbi:MAG: hypothetical protein HYU66_05595 [Armatimonadetes bacterium]|nr:hypothetical protein [Armatimonadota bacterium]
MALAVGLWFFCNRWHREPPTRWLPDQGGSTLFHFVQNLKRVAADPPSFSVDVDRHLWTRYSDGLTGFVGAPVAVAATGRFSLDGRKLVIAATGARPGVGYLRRVTGFWLTFDGKRLRQLARFPSDRWRGRGASAAEYSGYYQAQAGFGQRVGVNLGLPWVSPLWHGYASNHRSSPLDSLLDQMRPRHLGIQRLYDVDCYRTAERDFDNRRIEFWLDPQHNLVLRKAVTRWTTGPKAAPGPAGRERRYERTTTIASLLDAGGYALPAVVQTEEWRDCGMTLASLGWRGWLDFVRHLNRYRVRGGQIQELLVRETITFSNLHLGIRLGPEELRLDWPPGTHLNRAAEAELRTHPRP